MPRTNRTAPPESSPPTWRAAADCPLCGEPLRLRENRQDRSRFFGCTGYPGCKFAEPIDDALAELAERIDELECELIGSRAVRHSLPADVLAKELRRLIAAFHPDRNPAPIEAHRICSELTALRARIAA